MRHGEAGRERRRSGAAAADPTPVAARPPVRFYAPVLANSARPETLDPDADWSVFGTGLYVWVLQTYLRLRAAGRPVALVREPGEGGIVVAHHDDLPAAAAGARDALLVSIRSDRTVQPLAHVEILQNGRFADGRRTFYLPPWPQPGLLPRDPSRGERIERIAFKGTALNLHPFFRGEAWQRFLSARGLAFEIDEARYQNPQSVYHTAWNDYRAVDLVLALRPRLRQRGHEKPPSKLVNAWLAGVPALLGPEYAFRDAGTPDVDYLEVATPEAAMAAIDRLRQEPARYRALVEHGRERAREYDVAVLTARWSALLFDVLLPRVRDRRPATPDPRLAPLRGLLLEGRERWRGLRRASALARRAGSAGPTHG